MKNRLLALCLALLGVSLSLLGLEIALRIVVPSGQPLKTKSPGPSDRPSLYFIPEAANSMRGNIFDPAHPEGLFRIFVIGDSFTFAPEMQFDDAFPARLNRILNLNGASSMRAEVINYGTPGFSTHHELETYKKALTLSPDLILLQVTLNDPQERPLRDTPLPFSLDHRESRIGSVLYKALSWSRLYQALNARWFAFKSRRFYVQYHRNLFSQPTTRALFENSVKSMAALAKEQKVPFAVVIFPLFDFPMDAHYPFADIHAQIGQLLQSLEVPSLDLFSRFEGIDNVRLQLKPGSDTHPNEIAHRIAAEEIYGWLLRTGLIPNNLKVARTYEHRRGIEEKIAE